MLNIYAVSYMTATRTDVDSLRRLREDRRDRHTSERQRIWGPHKSWWHRGKADETQGNR